MVASERCVSHSIYEQRVHGSSEGGVSSAARLTQAGEPVRCTCRICGGLSFVCMSAFRPFADARATIAGDTLTLLMLVAQSPVRITSRFSNELPDAIMANEPRLSRVFEIQAKTGALLGLYED